MLGYPPPQKKKFKMIHLILIRLITIAFTLREHPGSPHVYGGVRVAHLFLAFCVVFFVLFVFVLCLVYPICCLFLIASSVFSNVYLQYLPLTWHLPVESLLLPWRGMLWQLVCYLHNFLTWKKNTWFKIPETNQSAKIKGAAMPALQLYSKTNNFL